jgi:hypothetical protein
MRRAAFVASPMAVPRSIALPRAFSVTRSPMRLGSPHRVDRTLDRGLRGALLADRIRGDRDGDFAHRRSPQRANAGARDVARALGVELLALACANDDHTRFLVERVHPVQACDAVFLFLEPRDRGPRRARKPGGRIPTGEERDDDRVDLAELRRTNCTKSH